MRKLKSMIPNEETKKRIQQLPKRHWIYLDGKTNPEIEIPVYKKEGHVTYLKPTIEQPKQPQKKMGFLKALVLSVFTAGQIKQNLQQPTQTANNEELEDSEESELDMFMTEKGDSDIMFPTEEE